MKEKSMKSKTKHNNLLKESLKDVLFKYQEANMVEHRYRTLRTSLMVAYPKLIEGTDKEVMINFLQDAIYLDRQLRKETEGKQELLKTILSQEKQIELGYGQ